MSSEMEKQLAILKDKYIATLPEKTDNIRTLWKIVVEKKDTKKLEELHRMVHSLAGSGATFDQIQLSQSAKNLELYLEKHISAGDVFEETIKAEVDELLCFLFISTDKSDSSLRNEY